MVDSIEIRTLQTRMTTLTFTLLIRSRACSSIKQNATKNYKTGIFRNFNCQSPISVERGLVVHVLLGTICWPLDISC